MPKDYGNWKQLLDYSPNRRHRMLLSLKRVWDKYLYNPETETLCPWKISHKSSQSWLWPYTGHGQLAKLLKPHFWRHLRQEPSMNKIKYFCLIWWFLLFNYRRLDWVECKFLFFTKSSKMPIGSTVSCT